jgi:hypothetical protein
VFGGRREGSEGSHYMVIENLFDCHEIMATKTLLVAIKLLWWLKLIAIKWLIINSIIVNGSGPFFISI